MRQNTTISYASFGSAIKDMSYSSDTSNLYRFGYQGYEKDQESFADAYDFGARIYDSRLGRWLALDPLMAIYPSVSPYDFVGNMPIIAIDPDGRLIIFAHGFIREDGLNNKASSKSGEKIYESDYYGKDFKNNNYWGTIDDNFMKSLNDYNVRYVNGENGMRSQAEDRMAEGKLAALILHQQIRENKVVLQKDECGNIIETITLVGHSQGAAYAAGMAEELIKLGYKVDGAYYVTPHQPKDIIHPPSILGVQYSHPEDKISSNDPWWLPNGGTELGEIKNISEYVVWSDSKWSKDIMGDRGGHNVGLNTKIFDFKSDEKGYVRSKTWDSNCMTICTDNQSSIIVNDPPTQNAPELILKPR